ncbi:MAG: cysteine--tRNA ligase [Polaromonas sp. 39-63-203]|jgi:cysteinyl-tRNA synthetase|uniref:cysteine--tRNA ligase n=1 Tax=Polaromonas sp. TaxID=1869339 RepID=UPI000BD755E8|nr:cysteine--tRNA ligase [Polaromonas sp.]OYY50403.1 MAG: cysteine--tRNA ligase [Polaromonas sp. 35-63-240]OYZ80763.1 MAG: cysteine--tRNA ligase [Polaromonas sp. 24-62-144]OZA95765.1 MAG: cysteine--tRNA ligase [Polaromonas sp. 39-63-203]HQS33003.1 cysteine--tRNA ligase [Polaromonas sp.]HQS91571.1 cysteine--tRNA ligase [Polaromonas sp.]
MSLRIYNTLSRGVEDFSPLLPGHVRMYVCGMTIYDLCHIGHARMMMAFDIAQRWLKVCGFRVTYVRNITDIDDKIIKRAVERGISIRALTDEMIVAMHRDIGALGIEPPTLEPRATDYVPQMLAMIATLENKGFAYRSPNGDVNYAVRKFEGYGKLSGKSLDELRAGERVAVLDGKDDPLDFVLWKSAKASEPDDAKWNSDYGRGRPGWHIECSAMSCQTLGQTFDIHGGGADLQFPHHENEIAQSEAANGKPLARFWMHNGFVRVDNEKMSKSLGNFFTIQDVLTKYDPETVRFFIVRAHYRSALNYSDVHLDDARNSLKRLYTALASVVPDELATIDWTHPFAARFKAAMDEDFGTPEAVAVLFELAGEVNRTGSSKSAGILKFLGGTIGLLQSDPRGWLQGRRDVSVALGSVSATAAAGSIQAAVSDQLTSDQIDQLITKRAAAKAAKNFAEADRIRQDLLAGGIVLKDSPAGTTWEAQS